MVMTQILHGKEKEKNTHTKINI